MYYLIKNNVSVDDRVRMIDVGIIEESKVEKWLYDKFEEYSNNGYICYQSKYSIRCESEKRLETFVVKRIRVIQP